MDALEQTLINKCSGTDTDSEEDFIIIETSSVAEEDKLAGKNIPEFSSTPPVSVTENDKIEKKDQITNKRN